MTPPDPRKRPTEFVTLEDKGKKNSRARLKT